VIRIQTWAESILPLPTKSGIPSGGLTFPEGIPSNRRNPLFRLKAVAILGSQLRFAVAWGRHGWGTTMTGRPPVRISAAMLSASRRSSNSNRVAALPERPASAIAQVIRS
jgi:hypothetical protein